MDKIKTTLDWFMKTGKSHNICEDYVTTGLSPMPHMILADGCSSSPHTDVGARILVSVARMYLNVVQESFGARGMPDYDVMGRAIIHRARAVAYQLGLPKESLDATLLISFLHEDQLMTFIYGDGYYFQHSDGGIMVTSVEFTTGAPYYLNYLDDLPRQAAYCTELGDIQGSKVVKDYFISDCGDRIATRMSSKVELDPHEGFSYSFMVPEMCSPLFVSIASDGLGSFVEGNAAIGCELPILELSRFKNRKGEFLKRRAKRTIKDMEKDGLHHLDDISVATMLFEEE